MSTRRELAHDFVVALEALKAEATVVHRGRQLLSTDCVIADADDRILARSSATFTAIPLQ